MALKTQIEICGILKRNRSTTTWAIMSYLHCTQYIHHMLGVPRR